MAKSKDDKKCWWQKLYWSDESIKKAAENYNNIPWYKSPRYGIAFIVVFHLLTGFLVSSANMATIFSALMIFAPLVYLIVRGYRPFLAIFLVYYTIDTVFTVYMVGFVGLSLAVWWVVTMYLIVVSYKIQNAREKVANKKQYTIDSLVALFLLALFAVSGFVLQQKQQEAKEFMYWNWFIYRSTQGVVDYCQEYQVDVTGYAKDFNKKYASQIEYVHSNISKYGLNPQSLYKDIGMSDEMIKSLVASYYDRLYKTLISSVVIEQGQINPQNFVWKDEYYNILPKSGFCTFITLNPNVAQAVDSDFRTFPIRIELMQK